MEESQTSLLSTIKQNELIIYAFENYHVPLVYYISRKIGCRFSAEDIAQDVFVRLIDYKQMLLPETVKSFLFTIAHNLVVDYFRRQPKKQEISANYYELMPTFTNEVESNLHVKDICKLEYLKLKTFTPQRKNVYSLFRYEDLSINEISIQLSLSVRTVENHLHVGRKDMRNYIKKCV